VASWETLTLAGEVNSWEKKNQTQQGIFQQAMFDTEGIGFFKYNLIGI
jgi:hypothetical protein